MNYAANHPRVFPCLNIIVSNDDADDKPTSKAVSNRNGFQQLQVLVAYLIIIVYADILNLILFHFYLLCFIYILVFPS